MKIKKRNETLFDNNSIDLLHISLNNDRRTLLVLFRTKVRSNKSHFEQKSFRLSVTSTKGHSNKRRSNKNNLPDRRKTDPAWPLLKAERCNHRSGEELPRPDDPCQQPTRSDGSPAKLGRFGCPERFLATSPIDAVFGVESAWGVGWSCTIGERRRAGRRPGERPPGGPCGRGRSPTGGTHEASRKSRPSGPVNTLIVRHGVKL